MYKNQYAKYYWDPNKTLEKEINGQQFLGELKFTTEGVNERFAYKRYIVTIKKLNTILVYQVFKNRKEARLFLETQFDNLISLADH